MYRLDRCAIAGSIGRVEGRDVMDRMSVPLSTKFDYARNAAKFASDDRGWSVRSGPVSGHRQFAREMMPNGGNSVLIL